MLKIALVANTFAEAKRFVLSKFKHKIGKINESNSIYILINGDEIHLCYDEVGKDAYKSMEYDAIIIHPNYESLLDVIRRRTERY